MHCRMQMALKRAFDIVVSLTVLTLFSPLMALIALVIKRDDGGPVLYVQERVGKDEVVVVQECVTGFLACYEEATLKASLDKKRRKG